LKHCKKINENVYETDITADFQSHIRRAKAVAVSDFSDSEPVII
jgi:hypothetical protein